MCPKRSLLRNYWIDKTEKRKKKTEPQNSTHVLNFADVGSADRLLEVREDVYVSGMSYPYREHEKN